MRKIALRALAAGLFAAVSLASCTGNPPGLWPNCVEGQWSFGCEGLVSDNSCGCKVTTKRQYAPFCAVNEAQAIQKFQQRFTSTVIGSVNCIQGAPGKTKQPNAYEGAPGEVQIVERTPSQSLAALASRAGQLDPRGAGAGGGVSIFGPGDCTVDVVTDNECVACVKQACCSDYEACFQDPQCSCWVSCKGAGNDDQYCEQAAACGALEGVASSAAACLDANCGAQCGTMEITSPCSCGSSSSSSGGTTCTGGVGMAGDFCFSNDDCQSCNCDTAQSTCF